MTKDDAGILAWPAYLLSRIAFVGTHLVVVYWIVFLFNNPLNFGPIFGLEWNTLDDTTPLPANACTPIIWDHVVYDVAIYMIWVGQHFIMARKKYKQLFGFWGTSFFQPVERPIFACAAFVCWAVTLIYWKPITDCKGWDPLAVSPLVWVGSGIMISICLFEILGLLYTLPHHVFGTDRWKYPAGQYPVGKLITTFPYNLVRHPAASGFIWFYWFLPAYSPSHILLALLWSAFILIGTLVNEEGGLHGPDEFGQQYQEYCTHVSALYPNIESLKRAFGILPPLVISGSAGKTESSQQDKKAK